MPPHHLAIIATLLATLTLSAEPLFENSVVSNDLDFIIATDASQFQEIQEQARARKEMPDRRNDVLFADQTFVYQLQYQDDCTVELWAHPDFKTSEQAQPFVQEIAQALGKLPRFMREKLSHIVLHKGDQVAFGEEEGRFFVLYSDNVRKRIATHDLEETIFHEATHATLEKEHAKNPKWLAAQKKDGAFITKYAARLPLKEDLPESALFAYTVIKHPGRLPTKIEKQVRALIPARIAYFEEIFNEVHAQKDSR